MKKAIHCSMLILAGFFTACEEAAMKPDLVLPPGCVSDSVMSYVRDIEPIVRTACVTSCHFPGSGIYDFSSYPVLADRIRSGRLEERLLLPEDHPLHMPQGFEMHPCNLYKLRLWISQGFPNN